MRRVLEWGAVPTMIPEIFDALIARRDRDHPGEDAPAVLNEVRNRLVHPPKTVTPRSPSTEELYGAWQLATWYLELVVLRVLGYEGQYGSRLSAQGSP